MTSSEAKQLILVYIVTIDDFTTGHPFSGIPSGQLYAEMMAHGVDLDRHMRLIAYLIEQEVITQSNHLLRIAPKGKRIAAEFNRVVAEAKNAPNN